MKITLKKNDQAARYENVEIIEPLTKDSIAAMRVAGDVGSGGNNLNFVAALIARSCLFDGKKLTYEEVLNLPSNDFIAISMELGNSGFLQTPELSSTESGISPKKSDGVMKK